MCCGGCNTNIHMLPAPQRASNHSIKKADVVSALQDRNIDFAENLYGKVMRSLCTSKGGTWSLLPGAPNL